MLVVLFLITVALYIAYRREQHQHLHRSESSNLTSSQQRRWEIEEGINGSKEKLDPFLSLQQGYQSGARSK